MPSTAEPVLITNDYWPVRQQAVREDLERSRQSPYRSIAEGQARSADIDSLTRYLDWLAIKELGRYR